jgi:hypothetical protein
MARYRKIDTRMWGDVKFRALSSPPPPSSKYLWIFLLTGLHTTNLPGLFRAGEMALAEELGWQLEGFREGFRELFDQGLVKADWEARVVWIPNAIKYNPPDNPNVVKSWRVAWDEVPECSLKAEAYQGFKAFTEALGEGFAKAFQEGCGKGLAKGMANQEQEQEQEQTDTFPQTAFADHPQEILSNGRKSSKPTEVQTEQLYSLYPRKRDKLDAKKAIHKAVAVVMTGDADHPAMQLEDALDYLARRVTIYAQCVQGRDPDFIPYPASWFNAGSFWDDERDWKKRAQGPQNVDDGYVPESQRRRLELEERRAAAL